MCIFLDYLFCSIGQFVYSYASIPDCLIYYTFVIDHGVYNISPVAKIALAIPSPLKFYMIFRMSLTNLVKKANKPTNLLLGILCGVVLNQYIYFGKD